MLRLADHPDDFAGLQGLREGDLRSERDHGATAGQIRKSE
jgi:hypothetical protein